MNIIQQLKTPSRSPISGKDETESDFLLDGLKKFLYAFVREDNKKDYHDRDFHNVGYVDYYTQSTDFYFDTGAYESPFHGTWRIASTKDGFQSILFPEKNKKSTDEIVELTKKKLSEDPVLSKCNCSVKNSTFKIILDQEYCLNDVYIIKSKPLENKIENKWYWPYKWLLKDPCMLFEDQYTYVEAVNLECKFQGTNGT